MKENKPIYFVSDVHFGYGSREDCKKREDLFIKFLDLVKSNGAKLFILGDLFDYWFEYNYVAPKEFFRILSALYDLKQSGVEISYIIGNHDFGHKDFFANELGINPIYNDVEIELNGKKFYLAHGDGKAKNDFGYLILRAVLRNKLANILFRLIHPDLGIWLASGSSRTSRKYTGKKNYGEDGLKEFAKKMIDKGSDFVIMGHKHQAEYYEYKSGVYVNLGEWIKRSTYVVFQDEKLLIRDFI